MKLTLEEPDRATAVPASLRRALATLTVLVVLGGIVTVLVVIFADPILRHWAEGNPGAREILATQGLEALKNPPEGQIGAPQIVRVTVVLYIVVALLFWVLGVFLRNGYEWARTSVTLTVVFSVVAGAAGIMVRPLGFMVAGIALCMATGLAVLVFLWHPDTTRYIHPGD